MPSALQATLPSMANRRRSLRCPGACTRSRCVGARSRTPGWPLVRAPQALKLDQHQRAANAARGQSARLTKIGCTKRSAMLLMSSRVVVRAMCWSSYPVNERFVTRPKCCANITHRIQKSCRCIRGCRPRSRIGSSAVTAVAGWYWRPMWRRLRSPCRVSATSSTRVWPALNAIRIVVRSSSYRSRRSRVRRRASAPAVVAAWPMVSASASMTNRISRRAANSPIPRFCDPRWPV